MGIRTEVRSFDNSMFREKAVISQRGPERLDVLPQVTAPHEWAILAGLALVLLSMGVWSVFGSIESRLTTECLLVRPGDRHAVLAELSGTVADVLVSTGDTVHSGQAVARVRRPELRRSLRIVRARIATLETGPASEQLRAARAELADLEMIEALGDIIVSPYTGEVSSLALAPGQPVAAGAEVATIRAGATGRMEVVAFIAQADAALVAADMAGRVLVPAEGGRGVSVLDADVRVISAYPMAPPGWFDRLDFPTLNRGHLVRLSLRSDLDGTLADGTRCRLDIVTRRETPLRFLLRTGGG